MEIDDLILRYAKRIVELEECNEQLTATVKQLQHELLEIKKNIPREFC